MSLTLVFISTKTDHFEGWTDKPTDSWVTRPKTVSAGYTKFLPISLLCKVSVLLSVYKCVPWKVISYTPLLNVTTFFSPQRQILSAVISCK